MEIDNHLLSLSMEFEKQNIVITEWETEKAKRRHDRKRNKRNKTKKVRDFKTRLVLFGKLTGIFKKSQWLDSLLWLSNIR